MNQHLKAEKWEFRRHPRCPFTIPEEKMVVERYKNGETFSDIAKELDTNRSYLWKIATKSYGVETYQTSGYPKKFDMNIHTFKNIHNEKTMYLLGLIYTDGHISKARKRLHFVTTDKDQMENFKTCLESTQDYFTVPETENSKRQYRIAVSYEPMIDDLLDYVPQSSKETKRINKEIVDSNSFNHFLRGFFDGDGCVTKEGGQVIFTGNKELMASLENIIEEKYGITASGTNKIKGGFVKNENHNTYHLGYYHNSSCQKFYKLFYDNANLYLTRKKNIFDKHWG